MNLTMLHRLVGGDPDFKWRVEAACWAQGHDFDDKVLRHAAANEAVQDQANMDEDQTIDSSGVSDATIMDAVADYFAD